MDKKSLNILHEKKLYDTGQFELILIKLKTYSWPKQKPMDQKCYHQAKQ